MCKSLRVSTEPLRLISDNTVISGVDADDVGVKEVRGVREWDTCFPYAIIDAEKEKIQRWSPIRNYWGDWTPTSVYIGAPEEFADWIGYPVDELLNGAAETSTDTQQSASTEDESDMDDSGGFFSRLLGN